MPEKLLIAQPPIETKIGDDHLLKTMKQTTVKTI